MPSREIFELDLTGETIRLAAGDDVNSFEFVDRKGSGKKGVTWVGKDRLGTPVAIKIVHRDDYQSHSLDAEVKRVRALGSRFANILSYGTPSNLPDRLRALERTYFLVEELVEGVTFANFCAKNPIDVRLFLQLTSQLCEALALLSEQDLLHNDLHGDNLIVSPFRAGPGLSTELQIKVIDTGSLKSLNRRNAMLTSWRVELAALEEMGSPDAQSREIQLRDWILWFSRTDQEWIVSHLVALVNRARKTEHLLLSSERKFLAEVAPLLSRMVDDDLSIRLDHPSDMFERLQLEWAKSNSPPSPRLVTPFDFISAELVRSDKRLNELFSSECPWYLKCQTTGPVYIYGPRGCGKSTILRMLSLSAMLNSDNPSESFHNSSYIGVYISCSSELRSRFWLFPKKMYPAIQADAILFFTMLLAEALLESLEMLQDGIVEAYFGRSVGLTSETSRKICEIVFEKFALEGSIQKLTGISWLGYARRKLALSRNDLWHVILTEPKERIPNPALIFELIREMEVVFPLLKEKHIAFLVDDYSNQRIPVELQRMLNQTISFAKQGNPIFKVTSEYQGVDLEGVQEGREVTEVNVGSEYVSLEGEHRSDFLEDIFNIRFRAAGIDKKIADILGRSKLSPGVPMARAIRKSASHEGERFYYHGIDTIADICSGDFAMALDLVKQIYTSHQGEEFRSPIAAREQHERIKQYADREHRYLRYHYAHGIQMSEIIEWLCWLAHESAIKCTSIKDKKHEPMVKTGLDIKLSARKNLPEDKRGLLDEMEKRGVLFCLDTSRSRVGNDSTERYQVRRILLAKTEAPLGRRDPIKVDHEQKLLHLLTEPENFARAEINENVAQERLDL